MKRDKQGDPVQVGRFAGSPVTVNLSVASARSSELKAGTIYRIWSSVDCFFKFGDSSVEAATTDHPIKAGQDPYHITNGTDLYCAAIVASGTGVLFISELDAL